MTKRKREEMDWPEPTGRIQTHHDTCWTRTKHHNCAVAKVDELSEELGELCNLIDELDTLHSLEDAVYAVRARAVEEGEWEDGISSWDCPSVVKYGELVYEIATIVNKYSGKEEG